jgi:diguanylate cyclase (GGDEF)-like protein/PAS domain S-box-containing protein
LLHPSVAPLGAAALAVALLCGVGLFSARDARHTALQDAQVRVASNRDATVRALGQITDDYRRTVASWARDPAVIASLTSPSLQGLADAQARLSILSGSKDSPAAFVTNARGRTVALYPAQPELIGKDFSFRDWFHGASVTGAPYVSSGYRSAAAGHPLVVGVAAPVVAGPTRLGYVTVLWQLDSVRAVIEGSRRDDGVTVAVADQMGQSLTDPLQVDSRGQPIVTSVPALTRAALEGRSVSGTISHRLQAAAPVPGLGWAVTASLPEAEAIGPALTFHRSLLGTLGVALLLVAGLSALSMRVARRRAFERRAADRERRRLTTLFASSPIGIIEGLPDGRIVSVNDAFAGMVGYRVEELLLMNANDLVHHDAAVHVAGASHAVREEGMSDYSGERCYRHRDGTLVPVLVSVVALREPGEELRSVAFVVDQREQRANADALQRLATTLAEREALLSTLFDTMDVAVLACDPQGALTFANHQIRMMHGLAPDAPLDAPGAMEVMHLDGTSMLPEQTPLTRALTEGVVRDVELLIRTDAQRPPQRMLTHARRMTDASGKTLGAVVAAHDVTATRAAEASLQASEERFRRIFDEGLIGKMLVSPAGEIVQFNAMLGRLLGPGRELRGAHLLDCFLEAADRSRIEALLSSGRETLHAEMALVGIPDQELWARVALSWIQDDDGSQMLFVQVEDVTARRAAELRLTELALHDELTGLPNRRLLMERCERAFAMARSGRAASTVAALFIDLDGFKPINDRAGHEAGDQLLRDIARDLQTSVRPSDTVARVGGDEFVILVERYDGLAELRAVADRIASTVRRPVTTGDVSLTVSASIGIAHADLAFEPELRPDQLLRRADSAMYRAKDRGRDRHDVFDEALRELTEARQALEQSMRAGLRDERIALVFQPVVDVDSLVVVGAEALMRLVDADGRPIPTLPAILAAESAGLAETLGDRVLHLALEAACTWPSHMSLAVNVSARELTGRDLRSRVESALRRHDFDPARLVLEITESSILSAGPSALAELEKLRKRGIKVAIDDFGTAYATLQNLTTLPVDALKVDTSFTAGLPHQRTHTAVVHGIASMAYELDIPCIVEGVENEEQLGAIRGMSVQAQGWLWGKPRGAGFVPSLQNVPPPRAGREAGAR